MKKLQSTPEELAGLNCPVCGSLPCDQTDDPFKSDFHNLFLLTNEFTRSIECWENDIGGCRPPSEVLKNMSALTDKILDHFRDETCNVSIEDKLYEGYT